MAVLGVRFIQFRSRLGLSTVRRNAQHWTLPRRREQDYAILIPCASAPMGRVAHDLHRAASGADPLQLAHRKKPNVWLSADQNGYIASSVPDRACDVNELSVLT